MPQSRARNGWRTACGIAIALLLFVWPASVVAEDPKAAAKQHVASARALHAQQRFAEAIAELEAAYALDPQPQLLFALGQLHVQLGKCERASNPRSRAMIEVTDGCTGDAQPAGDSGLPTSCDGARTTRSSAARCLDALATATRGCAP